MGSSQPTVDPAAQPMVDPAAQPTVDPAVQEMPERVEPMLARLSTVPADESLWAFEVKWDGVRAVGYSQPGRLRLLSRNGNEVTGAYPELGALNRALGSHAAILDGEIVAFDEAGRPSFAALQPRMHLRGEAAMHRLAQTSPVTYVLFDLLWLDGRSLLELSYVDRRAQLEDLVLDGEHWCTPEFHVGEGAALLAATRERGLEGVIAKRLDSRYTPGRRGGSWLKIKHTQRQELLIGSWAEGKGSRAARIGALHLGAYDEDGMLRYAGRVGTGFDEQELARLQSRLASLASEGSPFVGRQPARGAHFVNPSLVCEVEFTQWTKDGLLRHPVYKGLREDKLATTVVRERVQSPPSAVSEGHSRPVEIRQLIAEGRRVQGGVEVVLDGLALKLTNLDKVLYPKTGFTKGKLIEYYAAISPLLLAHLRCRPLTLKRYPDGVEREYFYEKQCPKHRPEWVRTTSVWSESSQRKVEFCLCQDLPTLLWLANLAGIELHPSLSRAEAVECPTSLVFDLDPGAPAGILECCEVALELFEMFAQLETRAFAKTSGSKGLQVYVPLNDEEATYERTKLFAHAVADLLERQRPELVVSRMVKAKRSGKVFVDWSQNDEHKTTISVYSLRAAPFPSVSTPVSWEEVGRCLHRRDPALLEFDVASTLERIGERGDLFAETISLHQPLPSLNM
jgi:bifunctional non-homologous end joining protein LigD